MSDVDGIERARLLSGRAVFGGDASALAEADRALDAVEADLAIARGRIVHARYLATREEDPSEPALFERAAELYRALGDGRGEGEALFWTGTYLQVVHEDFPGSVEPLRRSYELASGAGDDLTRSYAARHLGFAEAVAGRIDAARELLEESVRLRRELGFTPGVAAGVLALGELAARTGDPEEARRRADEAESIASDCGAGGILRWVEQFRADWL